MEQQPPLLWTLADYERFLDHPDAEIRFWAKQHITTEYPEQASRLLVRLVNDPDSLLQFSGIEALDSLTDPESEAQLFALLPQVDENKQGWIITYLARRQSARFLPMLLEQVGSLDLQQPKPGYDFLDFTRVEALGEYTDPQATALLWQVIDGYRWDSHFQVSAYTAQLRHPDAASLPRLLERLVQLKTVNEHEHATAWRAIAAAVGLERMFNQLADNDPLSELLEQVEEWWGVSPFSAAVQQSISDQEDDADFLRALAAEFQQQATARRDDLPQWLDEWQAGEQPMGYRRRTLYGWQVLNTLPHLPFATAAPHHARAACKLGILILGQYLLDEDDEARLAAATSAEQRRAVLLAVLASPRQNVYESLVEEVAALGPAIVPDLIPILASEAYWPLERTLNVVIKLARAHPGAADPLIPTLIDLLGRDVGDFINEACANAMRAVGPAIVEPLAAALTPENTALEIYGIGVLSDIPVQPSVDALEAYIVEQGEIDAGQWEGLLHLGQRQSIKFLRQFYNGQNPRLAKTLYTLGLLHGLESEAMATWASVVKADQREREQVGFNVDSLRRSLNFTTAQPMCTPAPAQTSRDEAARKARKKKRDQAKATKKAQQKAKKKKRR